MTTTHKKALAEALAEADWNTMQRQIEAACAQAAADAPDSLTELVRALATQDTAAPEQVAELIAELTPWVYEKGDRLDRDLMATAERAHTMTTVNLPAETEQWAWCQAHPDELDFPLAEAQADFVATAVGEVEAREQVAIHCAFLVRAGEHGTGTRQTAINDDWAAEWSRIVD